MKRERPGVDRGVNITCGVDDGRRIYNINDIVKSEAENIGVTTVVRPQLDQVHTSIFPGTKEGHYFDGRMPTVMKRLSLDQLSHLHSLLQSWYSYLAHQQAMWKVRKAATKQILDNTEACLRGLYKSEGNSDQNARDMATHDMRYVEDNAELAKASAIATLIDAALRSAWHNIELVTQELITRGVQLKTTMSGRNFNRSFGDAARAEAQIPDEFYTGEDNAETTRKVQNPKGPAAARAAEKGQSTRKSRWG
jgi:hypothetical protein